MFAAGETVAVRRGTTVVDPYSGEASSLSWDAPTDTPYDGCAVFPRYSSEPNDVTRSAVIVGLSVFMPATADVTAVDRLVIRGAVYEVLGEPSLWRSPFSGWAPGVEVAVQRAGA